MAGKSEALIRGGWRGLRCGLIDVLFPRACVSCGAEMAAERLLESDVPICADCLESLEIFEGPTCDRCGAQLAEGGPRIAFKRGGCAHCSGRKLWFDAAIAAGRYTGRFRDLLLRMKHAEGQALSLAIGRLLVERCCEQLASLRADVVVPVPMHWRRRLVRGTNSAAMLAEILASRFKTPLAAGLLRRRKHTKPQFECTPPQRWDNVRRAFSVATGYHLNDAHVLLVDDILTTGATCSEAARELRRCGATRVTVVVAARSISS